MMTQTSRACSRRKLAFDPCSPLCGHGVVTDDVTAANANVVVPVNVAKVLRVWRFLSPGAEGMGSASPPVPGLCPPKKPAGFPYKLSGTCWRVEVKVINGVGPPYASKLVSNVSLDPSRGVGGFDGPSPGVGGFDGLEGRFVAVEGLPEPTQSHVRPRVGGSNAQHGFKLASKGFRSLPVWYHACCWVGISFGSLTSKWTFSGYTHRCTASRRPKILRRGV